MDVPTYEEIFEQSLRYLKLSGIPCKKPNLDLKFYIYFIGLAVFVFEESCFFVTKASAENFLQITGLLPCILIGIRTMLKIVSIVQKRAKLFKLIECLGQLYNENVNDREKRNLISGEIMKVKSLTRYYYIFNWVLITLYSSVPLQTLAYFYITQGTIVLIISYPVVVPFSLDVFQNWLFVYLHSIASGYICVAYYSTVDTLYCNLATQVCANYQLLGREIEALDAATAGDVLPTIVRRHQYINDLTDDLEEIFTACNFYNILVGAIEICALGFNITVGGWALLPIFVMFLFSELLQILVMSIFGENIIRESLHIGQASFFSDWYNMDQKAKKFILIIMIRTQKPKILTALRFSTICYESFTKIISTSWSYFTILRTVYSSPGAQSG